MAQNVLSIFSALIMVQLLFSLSITLVAHAIPDEAINYVDSFGAITEDINAEEIASELQGNIQSQTEIPVIELGALVFYSGNLLIDLVLNFAFAIPQMLTLLLYGITSLISLDTELLYPVQIFFTAAVAVMYFISVMRLLTGIRTGRFI